MGVTKDWIGLVEAAYDLSGDADTWLARLLEAAEPVLDAGHGVSAQLFRLRPVGVAIERAAARGAPELARLPEATVDAASLQALDRVYRAGVPAGTMSEVVWSRLPGEEEVFAAATGGRFRDAIGIVAHTGTGSGLALNSPLPETRTMGAAERRHWTRVCAHVGAGLRLRERWEAPEAMLSPDGRVVDARDGAEGRDARERLRHAVRALEEARGSARRREPEEALALWEGLVGGRWSLVDRFESDGRRYLLAVPNDPEVGDPRGLSRRERQVAEFVGLGRASKEIAYALGLSTSAVSNAERRVRQKLGLGSRSELATFFAPGGLRRRLTELEVEGASVLLATAPLVVEGRLARLTEAEREAALLAVQGATNTAIAARRGTSERTVANQLASAFRKLGVHSRAELAATLSGADGQDDGLPGASSAPEGCSSPSR
ncbi:MAG: helix-turn-helix transcriptional regulator [Myxococcota bacterium]